MKMPKTIKRFCPKCKKQLEHQVSQVKTGKKRGALKLGARRFKAKTKGYTGFPRPKPEKSKKWAVKVTKKIDIRYKCATCNKMTVRKQGIRLKKFELGVK